LSGLDFGGYEIHHGVTAASKGHPDNSAMRPALSADGGWQRGQLLALYPHGLFEDRQVIKALFGAEARTLEDVMEGLADFIGEHFARDALMSYLDPPPKWRNKTSP
jgi:adenosylcobyric acid synthase